MGRWRGPGAGGPGYPGIQNTDNGGLRARWSHRIRLVRAAVHCGRRLRRGLEVVSISRLASWFDQNRSGFSLGVCQSRLGLIVSMDYGVERVWLGEGITVPWWGKHGAARFLVHARPAPGCSRRAGHATDWCNATAFRLARLRIGLGWQRRIAGVLVGAVAGLAWPPPSWPSLVGLRERERREGAASSLAWATRTWGRSALQERVKWERERWDLCKILQGRLPPDPPTKWDKQVTVARSVFS
jgi:hypothetical protein